jgi:N-acetyl-anhydromuramyl-L-alanine amidase AmpD
MFEPDYPMAVVWPADPSNYGYAGRTNYPKGFCIHVAEEPADPHGGTPLYFAKPHVGGSTHYFIPYGGGCYQMVPEAEGAWANGVVGKPYPGWADPNVNLNLQSLSVEIEGYCSTLTLPTPQWKSLVDLVQNRCTAHGIPLDRAHIFGHYEVSVERSDPGPRFPWQQFIDAVLQDRADEVFLAVSQVRANLMKLVLESRWQDLLNALWFIGVRPTV